LRLQDFLATQRRVSGLGIFTTDRFHLEARDDAKFDVNFEAVERNGWGTNIAEALPSTLRGVFYQTKIPQYFNVGGFATNVSSLIRWDAQKRRLMASLSAPPWHNPRYRYRVDLDLRNENWGLRQSSAGPAPSLGALNLSRESLDGEIASFGVGRWSW